MTRRRWVTLVLGAAALVLLAAGLYEARRPLPEGLSVRGEARPVEDLRFLADRTFLDAEGRRRVDQEIFDEVIRMIDAAEELVLLDMFLFNDVQGAVPETTRGLADELTQALMRAADREPAPRILVITDPINEIYGSVARPQLDVLEAAGVPVVRTNLRALRDSNPLWSTPWRLLAAPFGRAEEGRGWLPNPFTPDGEPRVSLRAWLELLNFKANHRKVLVVDEAGGALAGLVTSANPHDASSAHDNVALRVRGPVARDLLDSELAVAEMSVQDADSRRALDEIRRWADSRATLAPSEAMDAGPRVALVTEGGILEAVLETLHAAGAGDRVDLLMFYLSERHVLDALVGAAQRGADVRVLLDPNKDAFGREKNGIPNRPVARELRDRGVTQVRWCDTHGEQCHGKMLLVRPAEGPASLILGSANLTRRNLRDLNLETNLLVRAAPEEAVIRDAAAYTYDLWTNSDDRLYSVSYDAYAESSLWKALLYRLMEATGVSTF